MRQRGARVDGLERFSVLRECRHLHSTTPSAARGGRCFCLLACCAPGFACSPGGNGVGVVRRAAPGLAPLANAQVRLARLAERITLHGRWGPRRRSSRHCRRCKWRNRKGVAIAKRRYVLLVWHCASQARAWRCCGGGTVAKSVALACCSMLVVVAVAAACIFGWCWCTGTKHQGKNPKRSRARARRARTRTLSGSLQMCVKDFEGRTRVMNAEPHHTTCHLKRQIHAELGVPASEQRLIHKSRQPMDGTLAAKASSRRLTLV